MIGHWRWTAALLAAAGAAALGLWNGVVGWPDLTTHLRDDAFYEFTWACNLVRGAGPTVSDGTTTSGVQMFWCLLLAWLAGGQPHAIADVAIVTGVLCHVLAALSWVVAARGRPGGVCIALLWLGNPLLVRECQNGQETALACLCAVLLWHGRRARESVFAPLLLVAVFTRSDLFALGLLLSLGRHGFRVWRGLATPVGVLMLFLAGNMALGGGPLPDSALPMAWLSHANFAARDPAPVEWLWQQWQFLRPVLLGAPYRLGGIVGIAAGVFLVVRPWLRWRLLPSLLVIAAWVLGAEDLAIPAIAALLLFLLPAPSQRPVPAGQLACLLGLGAIVALHWGLRWYPRDYYAAPLAVAGAAALLHLRRAPSLLLLAAGVQALAAPRLGLEPLLHQRAMAVAGRHLADLLPDGERVGCFNAGIVAFLGTFGGAGSADGAASGPPVRVVNLDGVVDHRAFAALREGRLGEWLDEQAVRFVIDHPVQFATDPRLPHACGRWFGPGFDPAQDLLELARFVVPGVDAGRPGTQDFRLFWRTGRGEPPSLPAAARPLGPTADGLPVVLWPAQPGGVLEVEGADGARRELVRAGAVPAVVVVVVPADRIGTGRLFERGADEPLVVLGHAGR